MEMTLKEIQMELEHMFNKNQLLKRIRSEFEECTDFNFGAAFEEMEIEPRLGISILTQMAIQKRCTLEAMIGALRSQVDNIQEAADALSQLVLNNFIAWDEYKEEFIVVLDITPAVQNEVDTYQYPLPLVIKPKKVKDNFDRGYYTTSGSIILKNNHHDFDVCLDHINRVNSIPLMMNVETVSMVKNSWKGLDKQKEDETRADYLRRVKAFKRYDDVAHNVIDIMVQCGNRFYLTHRPDKRGRIYSQGHHINYQGNDWNKATVEFADGEAVCG